MLLDVKDPAESVVVEFDFTGELSAPTTAVVTIAVLNGADPNAAAMLQGTFQISGPKVYQRVALGVAGVDYGLRCLATQGSDVRLRTGTLPVRSF